METWTFGKCELYHWIDILDIFDTILEWAAESVPSNRWALACDVSFNADVSDYLFVNESCDDYCLFYVYVLKIINLGIISLDT